MKFRAGIILAALSLCLMPKISRAQSFVYGQTSVSINSATVPVSVIPAVPKSSWCVKVVAAAANPIYCFAYTTTLPSTAPATCQSTGSGITGCWEVSVGNPLCDAVNQPGNVFQQNGPFQQGIACEFQTSGSSVTAEGVYR